jgi:CRP/FNR family transcriptional regulator, cyclic AMP receptor protein
VGLGFGKAVDGEPPDGPYATASTMADQGERRLSKVGDLRREQQIDERVALLEEAPLFSVLRGDDARDLADKFHEVRYRKGEVIFREGEPAEHILLIAGGRVKLSIASPAGQELLIAMLGPGQIFGELSVVERGPRAMDARAMEDCRLYGLAADVFWTLLEGRPALARRFLELMARRLRRADQAAQDLVFFDAPTRLARKLLELAEDHGEREGERILLAMRLTQEEVAQMIGVTRESANRLIASFAGRGWIDWNDGKPVILQPQALIRRSR